MKLNILFVLNKYKTHAKELCVIMCRITYNKIRKTFSTGLFVRPNNWNSKQQIIKPPEPERDNINTQLSLIKTKINRAFLMLQVKEVNFTVDDVYSLYKGEKLTKEHNLAEYFECYLKKLKTLIGIDIKQVTWNKFNYVKNDAQSFIKWKFKTKDLPLKELRANFLTELDYYFKTQQKIKQVTIQ